jgi:membrane protease YdiL (CAAX protease family)
VVVVGHPLGSVTAVRPERIGTGTGARLRADPAPATLPWYARAPMADDTRPAPGAGSALVAYGALLLGFLAIGIVTQQQEIVAGLWVTEALAIALPAVIAVRGANLRIAPYLGLRKPTAAQLGLAVLLAVANQPVVSLLTWASRGLAPAQWAEEFDSLQRILEVVFAQKAVAMMVTVSVAAPLAEELFFRGFALPALARSWGPLAAAVTTGAMFSVLHLNKVGFLGLWEIGVLLALLRLSTGSLWPSVVCHATNNAIAGAAFLLGWEDPSIPPPTWLLALGAALLVAAPALALRVVRRAPGWQVIEVPPPGGENSRFRARRAPVLESIWLAGVLLGAAQALRILPPLPMATWILLGGAGAVAAIITIVRDARAPG